MSNLAPNQPNDLDSSPEVQQIKKLNVTRVQASGVILEDCGADVINAPTQELLDAISQPEATTEVLWLAYKAKIRVLVDEVYSKAQSLYGDDGEVMIYEKVSDFSKSIPAEINSRRYISFHTLIRSTVEFTPTHSLLDMPEPYSVEVLLRRLTIELDDREKCLEYIKNLDNE